MVSAERFPDLPQSPRILEPTRSTLEAILALLSATDQRDDVIHYTGLPRIVPLTRINPEVALAA